MAWTLPARTVRSTPSLATTPGKRLTMSRSSIATGVATAVDTGPAPSPPIAGMFYSIGRNRWRPTGNDECPPGGPGGHSDDVTVTDDQGLVGTSILPSMICCL